MTSKCISESYIELKIRHHAEIRFCLTYKFSSPSRRGVPDRIFIHKGNVMFVEFKRLGKKPSRLQQYTIDAMRKMGADVHVIDNIVDGKKLIDEFVSKS